MELPRPPLRAPAAAPGPTPPAPAARRAPRRFLRRSLAVAGLLVAAGCSEAPLARTPDEAALVCPTPDYLAYRKPAPPSGVVGADADGDGVTVAAGDCDDASPWVRPGARETCDLLDNDCDGSVDEEVCPDPATACPISYTEARCCDARHTIAGRFFEPPFAWWDRAIPDGAGSWDVPYEVLVRRRGTGELRRALVCAAPPGEERGLPFRFHLRDDEFVRDGEEYELLVHLRWYLPEALSDPRCFDPVPTLIPRAGTAASCLEVGSLVLSCQ